MPYALSRVTEHRLDRAGALPHVDAPDRRGDPRDPEALQPAAFSVAVHEALTDLASRHPLGGRPLVEVAAVVSRLMRGRRTGSPALRARLRHALHIYLQRFEPPAAATPINPVDRCFDLAWRLDGVVWVDEVKCGSFVGDRLPRQIDRQVAVGCDRWGESFVGVRVVSLGRPCAAVFCSVGRLPRGLTVNGVVAWERRA